ncbi:general transcription factor 3C polypeptide 2 isoform X2 [Amia ocellicauda]|uniref:general transcription factor 3C polypeptide 2 isoform X2 n=1 Tax=Amia ocellicauda TaxID=2972642 RepID=UPI003464B22F
MAAAAQEECRSNAMGVPSELNLQGQSATEQAGPARSECPKKSDRAPGTDAHSSAFLESGEEKPMSEGMSQEDRTSVDLPVENGTGDSTQYREESADCSGQQQNKKEGSCQIEDSQQLVPEDTPVEDSSSATPQSTKLSRSRKNPLPKKLLTPPQASGPQAKQTTKTPQPAKECKKRGRRTKAELLALQLHTSLTSTPTPAEKKDLDDIISDETTPGGRPKRRAAKVALQYLHNLAEEMGGPTWSEKTSDPAEPDSGKGQKRGRGKKRKTLDYDSSDDVSKDADFVLPNTQEMDIESEDEEDMEGFATEVPEKGFRPRSTAAANKPKYFGMAANGLPNNVMGPVWNCTHVTKEFREQHCASWAFPEWIPSVKDWIFLSSSESEKYLPKEETSPPFRIEREGVSEEDNLHRIKRFESLSSHHERWDLTFFVGGPVWSMEWSPCQEGSSASQYAAIYSNRGMDDRHRLAGTHSEAALLQIWHVGELQHDTCPRTKASFAYGIALDYGCIWDMKWCPSGAWELPSTNRKVPQLPRLGLLAAAFSNGKIAVFSLPHPEALAAYRKTHRKGAVKEEPLICQVRCTAVLKVGSIQAGNSSQCGQCFSLDWLPMKPHNTLAAGFYDGTVALWNLETKSLLQRVRLANGSLTLYPYHCFIAHDHAVRVLTWCKASSNLIVTSSEDRKVKFWDLRRTYEPVNVIKRYLTTEISWLLHWSGVCVSQENCYATFGQNGIHYLDAGYFGFKPYFVAPRRGTVWSISGSDWLNTCVTGDTTGELIMMVLSDMTLNPNNIKRPMDRRFRTFKNALKRDPMKHMYATETKGALPLDRMPLDSLHKVRFNPNLGSHSWVLSAGQAGIVRAHCLRGMNSPVVSKLVHESQAQFNTMYQPQGATANESTVTAVNRSLVGIMEVQ